MIFCRLDLFARFSSLSSDSAFPFDFILTHIQTSTFQKYLKTFFFSKRQRLTVSLINNRTVQSASEVEEAEEEDKDNMEIAVKALSLGFNPRIVSHRQIVDVSIPKLSCKREFFWLQTRCVTRNFLKRKSHKYCPPIFAVLSAVEDTGVSSSQYEDVVVTTRTNKARELKISVEVSGAKTRAIFDDVFDKMVAAAQPIPGFRRVKGGKTPNIPRDILLEVLGPTNVYKEVIKKVINTAVAEYVEKEDLKVGIDLRVEQSFEDLEELFEPDEKFSFDAVIQLQETD